MVRSLSGCTYARYCRRKTILKSCHYFLEKKIKEKLEQNCNGEVHVGHDKSLLRRTFATCVRLLINKENFC